MTDVRVVSLVHQAMLSNVLVGVLEPSSIASEILDFIVVGTVDKLLLRQIVVGLVVNAFHTFNGSNGSEGPA